MTSYYCSQGHENPLGSRFCLQCGEKLDLPGSKGIHPGLLLGDRYQIVRQLGQGGFGRTYAAEDKNRFSELCVLKEFAPQVQGTYALQKGEQLFEREAGVLYKLQHPQIPRFRELFRVNLDGKGYLFLVQDYVEGQTYRALLDARKQNGFRFNEVEINQLLLQILPVLEYIHTLGVIHRDISPDNLILRSSDGLPVLIDFGGVKQVAATVVSQLGQPLATKSTTLLGKVGYAPHEQMLSGRVYPHSDLYALAATVVVLLTGKEPDQLIDDHTLSWLWRKEVQLSPTLATVLDKMLSQNMSDRYQSARQVLQALTSNVAAGGAATHSIPHTQATLAVAPASHSGNATQQPPVNISTPTPHPSSNSSTAGKMLLLLLLASIAGIGWWVGNSWIQSQSTPPEQENVPEPIESPSSTPAPEPVATPQFSVAEQNRKQQLRDRRQQLGIDRDFYVGLVNQFFWDKYPNQQNRDLSSSPEDANLRAEWDETAAQVLDKLQSVSSAARRQLGNYTAQDRERWATQVNKLYVGSRALYDLADAAFFNAFPQQRNKDFIEQPIGQVWQAFAADQLNALTSGAALERVEFAPGATSKQVSGTLQPGEGKVYIARLTKDQFMKFDLQANSEVLISVYPPTGKNSILEDSRDRAWSGTLAQAGFYEFVVVSTASEAINYGLEIAAENIDTPESEAPPATAAPLQ